MEGSTKIHGLEDALKAMQAAFPNDEKAQRQIINSSLRSAATKTMLREIKARALQYKDSGALAESIGVRAMSRRKLRTARRVGGVEIAPIRSNRRAMAMYIQHHYNAKGRAAPRGMLFSGIRHGHFVEFGVPLRGIPARSFLWEGGRGQVAPYLMQAAREFQLQTERRVARAKRRSKHPRGV
jgi:hypothetical protein